MITQLTVDQAPATEYLGLLGYAPDSCLLRAIQGKGFKADAQNIKGLPKFQDSDKGLYLAVNGGQTAAEVTEGRALFCEFDTLPIPLQRLKVQETCRAYGLPLPSFSVETRNSVHSYWLLPERLPIDEWLSLQNRLIYTFGADPSTGDASRIMRLPGSWHVQEGKEPLLVTLVRGNPDPISLEPFYLMPEIPGEYVKRTGTNKYPKFDGRILSKSLQDIEKTGGIDLFTWEGHRFTQRTESHWDGYCPWHESTSGTSFQVDVNVKGKLLWCCKGCDIGGDLASYVYSLEKGYPISQVKGKDFADVVLKLCKQYGDPLGALQPRPEPSKVVPIREGVERETEGHPEGWGLPWPSGDKLEHLSSGQFYEHLMETFGPRLTFNLRALTHELDGQPLESLETMYVGLQAAGYGARKESVVDAIIRACKKNPRDPIKEEFDSISPYDPTFLDTAAERFLGSSGPEGIYNVYLKKTLISLVARIYQPGCKVDTVMVLKGDQGKRKSMFWESLVGQANFCDDLGDLADKDQLLKAHRYLLVEWAELDRITTAYHAGKLKGQITTRIDNIRPPYGRDTIPFPRRFIICGSTNEDVFLQDSTGDRRYWVAELPEGWTIPTLTAADRLHLLGAAKAAYEAGQPWWLTGEEEEQRTSGNKEFRNSGKWIEVLEQSVPALPQNLLTSRYLLEDVCGKPTGQWTTGDARDLALSMRALGYGQKVTTVEGIKGRFWFSNGPSVVPVRNASASVTEAPLTEASACCSPAALDQAAFDLLQAPDRPQMKKDHPFPPKPFDSNGSTKMQQIQQINIKDIEKGDIGHIEGHIEGPERIAGEEYSYVGHLSVASDLSPNAPPRPLNTVPVKSFTVGKHIQPGAQLLVSHEGVWKPCTLTQVTAMSATVKLEDQTRVRVTTPKHLLLQE